MGALSASKDSWLQWLLNKALVPVLLHPVGKAVVLALLVVGIVCGGIGVTRLGEGLKLSELAPDGHYAVAYDNAATVFERNGGAHMRAVCCCAGAWPNWVRCAVQLLRWAVQHAGSSISAVPWEPCTTLH